MLVDIRQHLLDTYLGIELYARCFGLWKNIEIAKDIFKYTANVALNNHLITIRLFTHHTINTVHKLVHFIVLTVIVSEYNERQQVTANNWMDIFLINCTCLRRNHSTRKYNVRHWIGCITGHLSESVKHISVNEYTVSCFQNNVILSNLVVQNTAFGCGDFKEGMPMQRARIIWQGGKLVAVKCDGKNCGIMWYLFL